MKNPGILDLIKKNRSCRRFDGSHLIKMEELRDLVEHARLSASAGNLQPLKYILSHETARNNDIFSCLAWAAYLKDWDGPGKEERPTGYIVILGDTTITENFRCDHGIAAQSILLGARAMGLAGCIFAAINHKRLGNLLAIDGKFRILLVIALGKPVEEAVIDGLQPGGDIRYFRDGDGVHHVPKRSLDEIIVNSW